MSKKRSKEYLNAVKQIDLHKEYSAEEGITLSKKIDFAKFDDTISIAFKLNVDTKQADQQLRGAMVLPNGTGKEHKVIVFAKGPKAQEAKDAGADVVGDDDLIQRIKDGWLEFDVAIATPDMMAQVGRLGRILGPKGLMPNPKTGTVTMDVKKAVTDAKSGQIVYRTDRDGNIHVPIGKTSFEVNALLENFKSIYEVIEKARPASVKGTYIRNISVSSTFGPGIKIVVNKI